MTTTADVISKARSFVGLGADPNTITRQYGPSGWGISALDGGYDWCAVSTYVIARLAGGAALVSASPFVSDHISFHINQGTWVGDSLAPHVGDEITFTWDQDGNPDHIGYVESVAGGFVNTLEGNSSDAYRRRSYPLNSGYILGYGRPKYSDTSTADLGTSPLIEKDNLMITAGSTKRGGWILGPGYAKNLNPEQWSQVHGRLTHYEFGDNDRAFDVFKSAFIDPKAIIKS